MQYCVICDNIAQYSFKMRAILKKIKIVRYIAMYIVLKKRIHVSMMLLYCKESIPCYIVRDMIQYGSIFLNIISYWHNCTVLCVI